ncbi:peptidoglycan DD-metalloendopeptidase family protein [Candidatus Peregrinibacteria bacterium]|nr:peptidoglycan DD-metalloendopeptidase family protein [Candidatus Peregrinibacteria bacterium]
MNGVTPTHHWLSVRVRALCTGILLLSLFVPPYVPSSALAPPEEAVADQQFFLVEDGFLMKSSTLTRQGARRAYAKGTIHIVKEGDSLERLSRWYPVSIETIRVANGLKEGEPIRPGQELLILPVDGVLHTVGRGQTLSRIAQLYDVPQSEIMKQNDLKSEFIIAGQQIIIPGGKPIVGEPTKVATADKPPEKPAEPGKKPSSAAASSKPAPAKPAVVTPPKTAFTDAPSAGVLQKPCGASCYITQYFNAKHFALDMQEKDDEGRLGGPVFAAEDGTIIRADYGWNGGYGNVIEIDHGNGLVTLYGHNKELHVALGDNVQRGQTIASMGNTGLVYGKTGIHVHFEVRLNGVKKNPLLYTE